MPLLARLDVAGQRIHLGMDLVVIETKAYDPVPAVRDERQVDVYIRIIHLFIQLLTKSIYELVLYINRLESKHDTKSLYIMDRVLYDVLIHFSLIPFTNLNRFINFNLSMDGTYEKKKV